MAKDIRSIDDGRADQAYPRPDHLAGLPQRASRSYRTVLFLDGLIEYSDNVIVFFLSFFEFIVMVTTWAPSKTKSLYN